MLGERGPSSLLALTDFYPGHRLSIEPVGLLWPRYYPSAYIKAMDSVREPHLQTRSEDLVCKMEAYYALVNRC